MKKKTCLALLFLSPLLFSQNLLDEPFHSESSLKHCVLQGVDATIHEQSLRIDSKYKGTSMIRMDLPARDLTGKKLVFSIEARGENTTKAKSKWNGVKFILHGITKDGKNIWRGVPMPSGTFPWTEKRFTAELPENLQTASIGLGFQDSMGTVFYRNLRIRPEYTTLNFKSAANRAYADQRAGDGTGGWSDQGPDNDARAFNYKQKFFAGVPFKVSVPNQESPNTVVVMSCPAMRNGPARVELSARPVSARYLYLLHTLCYPAGKRSLVGKIRVSGKGEACDFEVLDGRDVANWWNPMNVSNAAVGATWKNNSGGVAGFYVSRFEIPEKIGAVSKIEFVRPENAKNSNMWILAAVTLTDRLHRTEPVKSSAVVPDRIWKVLPRPAKPGILPGSALDRSRLALPDNRSVLRVSSDGELIQEANPGKPVRILSGVEVWDSFKGRGGVTSPILGTHRQIEEYVRLMKQYGYSMTRLHYLDGILCEGTSGNLIFNPEQLDRFDYLVAELKKNGMYLNLDAMSSSQGYTPLSPWGGAKNPKNMKFEIYFDPAVRENWIQGVRKVLTHVNPYTGTRLVDEPLLSMVTGFNEQEFAFTVLNRYHRWNELIRPAWIRFLKKRYAGNLNALRQAWGRYGEKFSSFEEIPPFSIHDRTDDPYGKDVMRFIAGTQRNLVGFFREELRKMGCRALIGNYDMGIERYYSFVRQDNDLVFMHSYHAHPSAYTSPGSVILQNSSIGTSARTFRNLNDTKLDGKPVVITEYGCAFWNRYRYEQSFIYGAYAALQNFSGLTFFGPAVTVVETHRINPFQAMQDPIAQGSEFLTSWLFLRRDVRTPEEKVRVHFDSEQMFRDGTSLQSSNPQQSRLGLIVRVATAVDLPPSAKKKELDLKSSEGALVEVRSGYTKTVEQNGNSDDPNRILSLLKEKGFLSAKNQSDFGKEYFESVSGELKLNAPAHFMSIETPRFQGICAEAGTRVNLKDFSVTGMTYRGNCSLVSLEDSHSIPEAKRLILVYLTDALNSDMVFENPEHTVLRKIGRNPTLLATGIVEGSFRNSHGGTMKMYALGLDGARRTELPLTYRDGRVFFRIDTSAIPGGPSLYFEFTAEP